MFHCPTQIRRKAFLSAKNLSMMAESFATESSLQVHKFLRDDLAKELEAGLRHLDARDDLGPSRERRIPLHSNGATPNSEWSVRGPPHTRRYCVFRDHDVHSDGVIANLKRLQHEFFPSSAFRTWLALVSSLLPLQYSIEVRRFRPGLDYTLATPGNEDVRLDIVLSLTPDLEVEGKGKGKAEASWESGEWGGWEVLLFIITFLI